METFYKKHDLGFLLPWILRDECGSGPSTAKEERERMRLVYTAVTRPSHLLCLAMRREAITQDGAEAETRLRLEKLGWTLKDLGACEELPDDQS
jgi:ATP-dependent exoDNAse (exonuclease V) beta subunit